MKLFPNTDEMLKGDDGTPIHGGSIGANRVFQYFRDHSTQATRINWDIYLINLYTLARNAFDKSLDMQTMSDTIMHDIELLTLYTEAYHAAQKKDPPTLIFYIPNYNIIPPAVRRPLSPSMELLNDFYDAVADTFPRKLTSFHQSADSERWALHVGLRDYPHKELLQSLYSSSLFKGSPKFKSILLYSHCVMDLHLSRDLRNLYLIESYTGAVKTLKDFGSKLGDEIIPFNAYTHRLFGDSIHLAPLVQRKAKQAMLDRARVARWHHMSESEIFRDIIAHSDVKEADLKALKL